MKSKVIKAIFGFLIIASLMFAEYRFIMLNIQPYLGTENTVSLEIFGQIEEYEVELWREQ